MLVIPVTFTLRQATSGRSEILARITITARIEARCRELTPARTPIAAEHQTVAAVLRPCTLAPSLKITPAPRKPTPDTTNEATRLGAEGSPPMREPAITKADAPAATRA